MENQQSNPATKLIVRKADGTYEKGYSGNPAGAVDGWQPYRKRLKRFLAMPLDDLVDLVRDRNRLGKMSTIDVAACKQAYQMIVGTASVQERESALNRMEGDPRNMPIGEGDENAGNSLDGTDSLIDEIISLAASAKASKASGADKVDEGSKTSADNAGG